MRIMLTIEYMGTNFSGWQSQPNKRTVQNEIEKALFIILGQKIQIYGSGRTDSGVHALAQTAHFDCPDSFLKKFDIYKDKTTKLNKIRLLDALNANLPRDIKILKTKKVSSNFHARYDVKEKIYLYKMETSAKKPSPLFANLVGTCKQELDIGKMREASKCLIGKHDFTSFSSAKTNVTDFIRTINYIKIKKSSNNLITFEVSGSGFLYNMVRIIVGTLVDVGIYKIPQDAIQKILESKSRSVAGKTVSASGLYLKKVKY